MSLFLLIILYQAPHSRALAPTYSALVYIKFKALAHDNFEFDENGRKFSKQVEKEELLITSNFSISLSGFKILVLQTRKNKGLFGKDLKLTLTVQGALFSGCL